MGIHSNTGVYQHCLGVINFRNKVAGATPLNPDSIKASLRRTLAGTALDEKMKAKAYLELAEKLLRETRQEGEPEIPIYEMINDPADLERIIELLARTTKTTGFKHDGNGLYLDDYVIKAMIREGISVLFAKRLVGATSKAAKSFFNERVFVTPNKLYLHREKPDAINLISGNLWVNGKGYTSIMGDHEVCYKPTVWFTLKVVQGTIEGFINMGGNKKQQDKSFTMQDWNMLWEYLEDNGMGGLRNHGYGTFDLVHMETRVKPFTLDECESVAEKYRIKAELPSSLELAAAD